MHCYKDKDESGRAHLLSSKGKPSICEHQRGEGSLLGVLRDADTISLEGGIRLLFVDRGGDWPPRYLIGSGKGSRPP